MPKTVIRRSRRPGLLAVALALSLSGCLAPAGVPNATDAAFSVAAGSGIVLHADPIQLQSETPVTGQGAYRTLDDDGKPAHADDAAASPDPHAGLGSLTYVAQVLPVTVGGLTVQANDILIRGNRAYIAYNNAGSHFAGAIQTVDISDPTRPAVIATLRFSDVDINCLAFAGDRLIFGGAANPDKYGFHACVGSIDPAKPDATAALQSLQGLDSYATTQLIVRGNTIYASVGAKDGGIEVLNRDLSKRSFVADADLRWMARYDDGVVALGGTTDSSKKSNDLLILDHDGKQKADVPLAAFAPLTAYAKATIELLRGSGALLGLSNDGLAVIDLKAPDAPIFKLANPTDPSGQGLYSCNSASADGDLIFVANGEYGFRVFKRFDHGGCDIDRDDDGEHDDPSDANPFEPQSGFAADLGYHRMEGALYGGQHYSANQIAFRGQTLFVASGLGGVMIYALDATPKPPSAKPVESSAQPAPSAAATSSPKADADASPSPSASASASVSPSSSPQASASPSASPSATASPSPSPSSTATPSPAPTPSPSPSPKK